MTIAYNKHTAVWKRWPVPYSNDIREIHENLDYWIKWVYPVQYLPESEGYGPRFGEIRQ